jgi:putative MATE family efflux protein
MTNELGSERIQRLIWKFSIPAVVGMLVHALYSVVDRLYLGQVLGPDALAGMTLTTPYMSMLAGLGMLIGVGSSTLVSIKLGEKKTEDAERLLGQALLLIVILTVVVWVTGLPTLKKTLSLLGGSPQAIPYAEEYLRIVLYGNFFTHVSFGINNIMRSEGNPKLAMRTMIICAVANIILDPLLIFGTVPIKLFGMDFGMVRIGLDMGIAGAAWATVLSMMIGSAIVLTHFRSLRATIRLRRSCVRFYPALAKSMFFIGLSPFCMQMLGSAVMVVFARQIAAVAASEAIATYAMGTLGITMTLSYLLFMPIIGICVGIQPIIGFNYGAKLFHRVREVVVRSVTIAIVFCVVAFLSIEMFAYYYIRAFTDVSALVDMGTVAFRIFGIGLPLVGVSMIASTYCQSTNKPKMSIFFTVFRQAVVLIPLIVIFSRLWNITGIWIAIPASDLAASLVTGVFLYHELKKYRFVST